MKADKEKTSDDKDETHLVPGRLIDDETLKELQAMHDALERSKKVDRVLVCGPFRDY